MGFNERTHAFLAARFYVRLTQRFGERGAEAFLHATRHYAGQRGRRMAQRAIRDGQPLDCATYLRYGEWVHTPEIEAEDGAHAAETVSITPDYEMRVYACAWHRQFRDMGLTEAGRLYCRDLDRAICRGFNPDIRYEVPQTLHTADCCRHCIRDAGLREGVVYAKKTEYVLDFRFHCAHLYFAFAQCSEAIFGMEGRVAAEEVLADFTEAYGPEMTEALTAWRGVDFDSASAVDAHAAVRVGL